MFRDSGEPKEAASGQAAASGQPLEAWVRGHLPFVKRYWLAVLLQLALIAALIAVHGYTLATGRPVLLKTAPIDPWDPFRGQYLSLTYEISRLEQGKVPMEGLPYRHGQQVWVTVRQGDTYWNAVAVATSRPGNKEVAAGDVVLGGRVQWAYPVTPAPQPAIQSSPQPAQPLQPEIMRVFIRYGIEQFYVPEGEGQKIERNRQVQLVVEAVVDSRGRAVLRRVFADGKELRWR